MTLIGLSRQERLAYAATQLATALNTPQGSHLTSVIINEIRKMQDEIPDEDRQAAKNLAWIAFYLGAVIGAGSEGV